MHIVLDEEEIQLWHNRIISFEQDEQLDKFCNLLHFAEQTIAEYNCRGTYNFLCNIIRNIWRDLILHLQTYHLALLRKVESVHLLQNIEKYFQILQENSKNSFWVLEETTSRLALSKEFQNICHILELAGELLLLPASENPWVEAAIRKDKRVRVALSYFLADIHIHNLEDLVEF